MAYIRVPVAKNQPLEPGLYEITLAITGDISRATKADLQRVLSAKFGQAVEVVDWGRVGGNYVLQFRVKQTRAQVQTDDVYEPAAFWIPIVITVTAIAGAIYAAYQFTVEIKSAFALVSQPARDTAVSGVGVGAAGLGVGAALVGLYLLTRR
ncbi:MAG: hypothetical protein N2318_03290 [Meiothermus sp.]|nr:hypothetical protein [Meiothermus sp.]